ncbi:uncharacterized protein CLAFUR5_10435 [Fulvia fulva]|uniref:Heterokaryon incompatibility domain-containing protein n=1 Tax=Passalora fulva TaxID=5499 RepID=A0A9Q8PCF6_PASFU|nr:uncharacterized protein CLAFUR5_10435 [Fulvia fulva]UJO19918.1 hypothetical protein CLAFUR5_10435 [Fulvia fulva]
MQNMLSRDWFGRAWVLQEAVLARHAVIRCGRFEEDWKVFCAFVCDYRRYYRDDARGLVKGTWQYNGLDGNRDRMNLAMSKELEMLRWINLPFSIATISAARTDGLEIPILQLLGYVRLQSATDARDKVYAIMGLLSEDQRSRLPRPDYDAEVMEVYIALAASVVLSSRSLDVLAWKNPYVEPFFTGMPSWVPDWRSLQEAGNVGNERVQMPVISPRHGAEPFGTYDPVHNASLYPISPYNFDFTNERVLHARGVHVDAVADWSEQIGGLDSLPPPRYKEDFTFHQEQILDSPLRDMRTKLVDSNTLTSDAFWRIVSHDQYIKRLNRYRSETRRLGKEGYTTLGGVKFPPVTPEDEEAILKLEYRSGIELKGARDLILRTRTGYWGAFPRNTRPGDTVVVLFGARKPVLLRKHRSFHVFVGECYVHGIMGGEVMLGKQIQNYEAETEVFHIA